MKSRITIEWDPCEDLESEKAIAQNIHFRVLECLREFIRTAPRRPIAESVTTRVSYVRIQKLAVAECLGDTPL